MYGQVLLLAARRSLGEVALRGLTLGATMVLVVVVFALVAPRFPGVRQRMERIVRCRSGHLFTTLWMPLGSLKAVRLGATRYQRCPVGHHWSLVVPVDPASLSPDELSDARSHRDISVV